MVMTIKVGFQEVVTAFHRMGAMLLGVIISAVLHGVCLLQAFIYFMSRDPFGYRIIINALVLT